MVKPLEETALVVGTGRTALDIYSQRIGERLPVHRVIAASPAHWPDPPLKDAYRFLRIVRGRRKLLHLPNQFLARFGIFSASPFVITIHDLIGHYNLCEIYVPTPRESLFLRLDKIGFGKARHIIAISESTKKDVVEYLGIPGERISTIYQGVDHQVYYPRKHDTRSSGYVLFVGAEEPRKNFGTLLEAFSILKKDQGFESLKLIKAGHARGEKYRRTTLEAIDRLALRDHVVFTGFLQEEELARYYSDAGCFVLPSLYEGFSLPMLEAMACGCPVITSNTSSLPEVVGDAGILIGPYDAKRLAEALKLVLTNSKLRHEMIEKGLAQARKFTWEKTAQETLKVYEKVALECGI